MDLGDLMREVRLRAGLSQTELATRAGTSRPLSAHENARISPILETADRILRAAGVEFALQPHVEFVTKTSRRGRPITVPTQLTRLPINQALSQGPLPLHLNWSDPSQIYDLANRADRRLVYEIVLREGTQEDLLRYIDGALLVDLWPELTLPADVRAAWQPVLSAALHDRATS